MSTEKEERETVNRDLLNQMDATISNLRRMSDKLQEGTLDDEDRKQIEAHEKMRLDQNAFINNIVNEIFNEKVKNEDIEDKQAAGRDSKQRIGDLILQNINLLTQPNTLLLIENLSAYISDLWHRTEIPKDIKVHVTGCFVVFLDCLCETPRADSEDEIDARVENIEWARMPIYAYHRILVEIGIDQSIWPDNEDEYFIFDKDDVKSKLDRIDAAITSFSATQKRLDNIDGEILILLAEVLSRLGRAYFDMFAYGNSYFSTVEEDSECALQSLEVSLKTQQLYNFSVYPHVAEQWGKTKIQMGNHYAHSTILENEAESIEKSIKAFRDALTVFDPKNSVDSWAIAKRGLGSSYRQRVRGNIEKNLELSIDAYTEIINNTQRSDSLEKWAMTHLSLGHTYVKIWETSSAGGTSAAKKALACYEEAVKTFKASGDNKNSSFAHSFKVGLEFQLIRKRDPEDKNVLKETIEEYIRSYQSMITEESYHTESPKFWAAGQNALGGLYRYYSSVNDKDKKNNL